MLSLDWIGYCGLPQRPWKVWGTYNDIRAYLYPRCIKCSYLLQCISLFNQVSQALYITFNRTYTTKWLN